MLGHSENLIDVVSAACSQLRPWCSMCTHTCAGGIENEPQSTHQGLRRAFVQRVVCFLTCWYCGAPNGIVQVNGGSRGPPSSPCRPAHGKQHWLKKLGRCTGDILGLNISRNTSQTSLHTLHLLLSSGMLCARTPHYVTQCQLTAAGTELCNGTHRKRLRRHGPFSWKFLSIAGPA